MTASIMYYERLLHASAMEKLAKKKKKDSDKKKEKKESEDNSLTVGGALAGLLGYRAGSVAPNIAGTMALKSGYTPDGPSPLFEKLWEHVSKKGVNTYFTADPLIEKIGPFYMPERAKGQSPVAGGIVMHTSYLDPGMLAHEFGHSQIDRGKWSDLDEWAQSLGHKYGTTATQLGTIGNSFLAAAGKNYKLMSLIAGINAALNAPRLASEVAASWQGQNALGDVGGSFGDRIGAFKGVPSYALAAVAPAIPILGRYVYDKLTEPKDEEEDEKE